MRELCFSGCKQQKQMLANLSQRLWCRKESKGVGRVGELEGGGGWGIGKGSWRIRLGRRSFGNQGVKANCQLHLFTTTWLKSFFFLSLNHCIQNVRKESDWCSLSQASITWLQKLHWQFYQSTVLWTKFCFVLFCFTKQLETTPKIKELMW